MTKFRVNTKSFYRKVKLAWYWCFDRRKYWQYKHNPLPVWRYFDD